MSKSKKKTQSTDNSVKSVQNSVKNNAADNAAKGAQDNRGGSYSDNKTDSGC